MTKKEIEFLNTKGVLLQKHFVILHLLVEFAPFLVYTQMLKTTLNTKISTFKVFNLDLFSYLCGLYSTILERKSQSFFHLTSGYNIGR